MQVFCVMYGAEYEGEQLLGVFAMQIDADRYAESCARTFCAKEKASPPMFRNGEWCTALYGQKCWRIVAWPVQ